MSAGSHTQQGITAHTQQRSTMYIYSLILLLITNKYNMKEIRILHYVTCAIIILMMIEGLMTMGNAFDFDNYTGFGWFAQGIIVAFTVLTAVRIAVKVED